MIIVHNGYRISITNYFIQINNTIFDECLRLNPMRYKHKYFLFDEMRNIHSSSEIRSNPKLLAHEETLHFGVFGCVLGYKSTLSKYSTDGPFRKERLKSTIEKRFEAKITKSEMFQPNFFALK